MLSFIQKRLELKIIFALIVVVGLVISVFAYIDIRMTQTDTLRTSEQGLRALAASIKGSVNAAMKKGHQEDVQGILAEVKIPSLIDRIMIYDQQGTTITCAGTVENKPEHAERLLSISPDIISNVHAGDQTEIRRENERPFLSYYSPIINQPDCFRCHGNQKKLNGILRIDFSLHEAVDLFTARRNRILVLAGVMIAALVAALVVLLRIVIHRPVRDLKDAMARAGQGGGAVELPTAGEDELSDLKQGFVNMMEKIHELHGTNLEKEKELARNQEVIRFRAELQTMFDAMPDGVLLIDPNMNIMQSNPRAYDLLPDMETKAGRIGQGCLIDKNCPHQCIQKALTSGSVCEHQCKLTHPEKGIRHLHSICAPIVEDGRAVSVVEVVRDITERVKTERELEEKTAELVATNRLLKKIAITDSLTQVANRRYFDDLLYKEIKRYNRRKYSSLSLMMIDIDDFKMLNDKHGHLAGDMVLRDVATLLKAGVRETDTVARYGGEEFVVIMPDTHLDGAMHKAETLRKKIASREFPGHDSLLHITISIGVAAYASGFPHGLVEAADQALYQAKHGGKNRVAVNRPETAAKH